MKYFLFFTLILLCSCSIHEAAMPTPEPKVVCSHKLSIEQRPTEDKLHIEVVSSLDFVWITVQGYPRKKYAKRFYKCISFSVPKDEISVTIEAEDTCNFTL